MPKLVSNITEGLQPHFVQRLIEVDAEETPGFSLLKKGDPLSNPIAQQPIDTKKTASKKGKADGKPTQGAQNSDSYRILKSWNHWFDEPVFVGKKAEKLTDQAGIGKNKQYAREVVKTMKAIKTAADQVICDDTDMKAEGTDGEGSETRGLFKWASNAAQAVEPVDEKYRTPAGQISVVAFNAFKETTFQGLINEHHDNTGKVGKFVALAGIRFKQLVANWSILDDAPASLSYLRRFSSDKKSEQQILSALVNVLVCEGGRAELHLSRNLRWERDPSSRHNLSAYSMIGYNEGAAELRFGWEPSHEPLPHDGGGMKGQIDMNFAVCADPTGLIKYAPTATS
jgi:hypothetical protein